MKLAAKLLLISAIFWLGVAATTKIRLATQVIDQVPAGYIFAGPVSGSPAIPSFRLLSPFDVDAIPRPGFRRFGAQISNGSTTDRIGDVSASSAGTFTNAAASATEPAYLQGATSTTDGNICRSEGNTNYVVGRKLLVQVMRKESSTNTRRGWWGLTDQTGATMGAANDPAGNYAAFFFNPAVNANFLCMTKDGTTQNSQNSGVAGDTSWHRYEIRETVGVDWKFYIDGSLVCTNSTNLPTAATPLKFLETVTCVSCSPTAQNFRRAWAYAESDF